MKNLLLKFGLINLGILSVLLLSGWVYSMAINNECLSGVSLIGSVVSVKAGIFILISLLAGSIIGIRYGSK